MNKFANGAAKFERHRLANSLLAQAELCERIAANCFDERTANKYKKIAQECRESASREQTLSAGTVAANWPAIVAF